MQPAPSSNKKETKVMLSIIRIRTHHINLTDPSEIYFHVDSHTNSRKREREREREREPWRVVSREPARFWDWVGTKISRSLKFTRTAARGRTIKISSTTTYKHSVFTIVSSLHPSVFQESFHLWTSAIPLPIFINQLPYHSVIPVKNFAKMPFYRQPTILNRY